MKLYSEMSEREKDRLLERFLSLASKRLPEDVVFAMLFADTESGETNFVHNGDTLEIIQGLRELADRMEKEIVESN